MPQSLPDAELIARVVASGDPRAFEALVLRYQALVRGFLHRLAREHADDLAQETFIAAYRRIGHFRGEAKFSTWLVAIAYNALRQMQRSQAYQRKIEGAMRLEQPFSLVDERPEVHDLEKVLAWLDDDERALLALSYAHEYSHREISGITGMPIGTVKSKLARAKARILERLDAKEVQHV